MASPLLLLHCYPTTEFREQFHDTQTWLLMTNYWHELANLRESLSFCVMPRVVINIWSVTHSEPCLPTVATPDFGATKSLLLCFQCMCITYYTADIPI